MTAPLPAGGHKDPGAPDDDATRVLDQSRRYIEDFDQAVAKSSTPREVIDVMLAKYPPTATGTPVRRGIHPVPLLTTPAESSPELRAPRPAGGP
jgi:hypothetical protein